MQSHCEIKKVSNKVTITKKTDSVVAIDSGINIAPVGFSERVAMVGADSKLRPSGVSVAVFIVSGCEFRFSVLEFLIFLI